MKLKDTMLRALKGTQKDKTYSDGGGLSLLHKVTGGKYWQYNYRFEGKQKTLSLGIYPDVPLALARERHQEARRLLAEGIDPGLKKQEAKALVKTNKFTFRELSEEWFKLQVGDWSESHKTDVAQKTRAYIIPLLGNLRPNQIDKPAIKQALDILEAQNKLPTLKKVKIIISQILNYGMDKREDLGIVADWTRQLSYKMKSVANRATIKSSADILRLLAGIQAYRAISVQTHLALLFSVLTFCRQGEVRKAEWIEIDLPARLWRIPAEKMKARKEHIVPLATQTLTLLGELQTISGHCKYLFPSVRSNHVPMSEATVLAALRRMGFTKDELCAHGFRGMASTVLNGKALLRRMSLKRS